MFRAVIDDQVETDGVDLTNSVLMLDDRTDLDFVTDFWLKEFLAVNFFFLAVNSRSEL